MSQMKNLAIDWENAKRMQYEKENGADVYTIKADAPKQTQEEQILELLKERPEGITPGDALNEVG